MLTPMHGVLPHELYTADQVRAMDRHAIEHVGIPGLTLMERAGAAAFATLRQRWPAAKFLSVVCGGGNNGGDGYVIARLALEAGLDARVYALRPPEALRGDARLAFQAYRDAGGSWLDYVPMHLEHAEVIVDALFGTGLDREVAGSDAAVIGAINDTAAGVLAVDIPSGLHADSGAVLGCAVEADITVSFIGLKRGLFTGAGPALCGSVIFDDLDTPPTVRQSATASARLIRSEDCRLPRRSATAHKGQCGHVLVIGGDAGYGGAACLAASAAARIGAGLISVAAHPDHASTLNATRPELMCRGIRDPAELAPLLDRATVLALGPGLGQRDWSQALFRAALASSLPLVVDADALNLLAREPRCCDRWVLTPHPGEAARLLGTSTEAVARDRFGAITELQARYGGVVVLKGAGSLVRGPDGLTQICTAGNPGMASGGMGDVLTGVIAGLLAQGLDRMAAARCGVQWHAEAGDLAALDGQRGLLASDLLDPLRQLVNR
jgi:NAD(P)H-hydrate epimerase